MNGDSDMWKLSRSHRDDWDFLKGFYQREDFAVQQIQFLNSNITQLKAALQHAGYTSQQDRIALNKSNDHMNQLQETFHQSEAVRARIENQLHDEQQDHRMCQANLEHEYQRQRDTEKNLECIWAAHSQLQNIMSKVNCVVDDGIQSLTYNISDLALELSKKSQRILDLENQRDSDNGIYRAELGQLSEGFRHELAQRTNELVAQDERIKELELLGDRGATATPRSQRFKRNHNSAETFFEEFPALEHGPKRTVPDLGEGTTTEQRQKQTESDSTDMPDPQQQKRRRRGRGRTISDNPVPEQSFGGLPRIKEEDQAA